MRAFYEAHRPSYEVLLAESKAFSEIAASLQSKLDAAGAAEHYASVARFYGVTDPPAFTALYVWWPPVENVTANQRGPFLVLKYNPVKHREGALEDVDLPIHELTHYVSGHQPEAMRATSRIDSASRRTRSRVGSARTSTRSGRNAP